MLNKVRIKNKNMTKIILSILILFTISIQAQNNNLGIENVTFSQNYQSEKLITPTCFATPISCDLIKNGGFEENSDNPSDLSQIHLACGWNRTNPNSILLETSPEYFNTNSTSLTTSIPCNAFGLQNPTSGNINYPNNNAYIGMLNIKNSVDTTNDNYYETIFSRLKEPLQPNTSYQLSFDVSRSEGYNSAIKFQAYLSNTMVYQNNMSGEINVNNPNMLFTDDTFAVESESWKKIIFQFTTGEESSEEYIYLGALSNVEHILTPSIINNSECAYNIVDSSTLVASYYYVDNVELIETHGVLFSLPSTIANDQYLNNLAMYLNFTSSSGYFSGVGVSLVDGIYVFDASIAGIGSHTISYTYNYFGCQITLYNNIFVTCANPTILPEFEIIDTICFQSELENLPTLSLNGIYGNWSPPINNLQTTTYTFSPDPIFCAQSVNLTIEVLSVDDPNCEGQCYPYIVLSNPENNNTFLYKAISSIELNSNYSITGDKNITMRSGKEILLKPNTFIEQNSEFLARIESCNSNINRTNKTRKLPTAEVKIDDKKDEELFIYPNPSTTIVSIKSIKTPISQITLYSIDGRKIFIKKENNNYSEIDVSQMLKGIYIIDIQLKNGDTISKKIIKN